MPYSSFASQGWVLQVLGLEPLLELDPDLEEVLRGLKQKAHPFPPQQVLTALTLVLLFREVLPLMEVVRLDEVQGVLLGLLELFLERLCPFLAMVAYLQFRRDIFIVKLGQV